MRQNTPIVAVLLAGLVLATGVVGVASLREGAPGPEDVAIRVDGVEVTFAEFELRREVQEATRPITERLTAGEDFGMPPEFQAQMTMVRDLFAPFQVEADHELAFVGSVVSAAATRNAAARESGEPSEEAVSGRIAMILQADEVVRTSDEPVLGFARALDEAQVSALGEERYLTEWVPLQARDGLARQHLIDHLDLTAAEAGVMPMIMGMRAAQDAEIWLHPSLGVSPEEVGGHLDQQVRFQEALLQWQEEFLADYED